MAELGNVLIADDEEVFLLSTADLLRRDGFHCDTAPDAGAALETLDSREYDVIIADIRMPGNADLEFIRSLEAQAVKTPVILVTGYPSLDTAIQSIHLPVVTYLLKPVDFAELLGAVRTGVRRSRTQRAVIASRKRLAQWGQELDDLCELSQAPRGGDEHVPLSALLNITVANMVASLADLGQIADVLAGDDADDQQCHKLSYSRPQVAVEALKEAITVLEKTKSAFKSKELGDLRRRLERVVRAHAAP